MLTRYGYKFTGILMGQTDDKAVTDTILTSTDICLDNRGVRFRAMVFGATLNNLSAISWQTVLLVENRLKAIDLRWYTISHNIVSSTTRHQRGDRWSPLIAHVVANTNAIQLRSQLPLDSREQILDNMKCLYLSLVALWTRTNIKLFQQDDCRYKPTVCYYKQKKHFIYYAHWYI